VVQALAADRSAITLGAAIDQLTRASPYLQVWGERLAPEGGSEAEAPLH
jgi:hypothetical protein